MLAWSGFVAAAVRVGTPLGLAALGETIAERSGVINLGIEGAMLAGALASAAVASSADLAAGVMAGVLAGAAVAAIFALVAVVARTDQIIAGTAVTLAATGLTGVLAQRIWGTAGAGLSVPTLAPVPLGALAHIPVIGAALFDQSLLTYLLYLLFPIASVLLFRTALGLQLRACGESPSSAAAAGVPVTAMRSAATVVGGMLAGLAGASLVLAQVGTFTERMTAGRGFIAIAIVALGRWEPWRVGIATLLFGAATAMQFVFQATATGIPYQLFLALPYLLALGVLGSAVGRRRGPAALGVAP